MEEARSNNERCLHKMLDTALCLTNLADELLVQDITEPSSVLGPFSDELEAAYDFVLEEFAPGASDRRRQKLGVVQRPTAVRLEVQRRDAAVCC